MDCERGQPQGTQCDGDAERIGDDGSTCSIDGANYIAVSILSGVVDSGHEVDGVVDADTQDDARHYGGEKIELDSGDGDETKQRGDRQRDRQ